MKPQTVHVTDAEAGQKLLQFLERRLKGEVPRSAIMRWIRKGNVRVDKGRKKPFDRVDAGQEVRIPPYTPGEGETTPTPNAPTNLTILSHEKGILCIRKPAGLPTQGGTGHDDSVASRLKAMFQDTDFIPAPAHRLDRDTSGVLLAGSTFAALRELNELFATGGIGKVYLAWVQGKWAHDGTILMEDRMEKRGEVGEEKMRTGTGKEAKAMVAALRRTDRGTLLAIRLLTGRTHQIRVQLSERGHPILGDRKYGDTSKTQGLMLHCYAMRTKDADFSAPPEWIQTYAPSDAELRGSLALLD